MNKICALCEHYYKLTGIPIRYYKNGKLLFVNINEILSPDPVKLYENNFLNYNGLAKLYTNKYFQHYAVINIGSDRKIIVGPSGLLSPASQELEICVELNVEKSKSEEYLIAMSLLPFTLLDRMTGFIILMMHSFTNKVIEKSRIEFEEFYRPEYAKNIERTLINNKLSSAFEDSEIVENTYAFEKILTTLISAGETEKLKATTENVPQYKAGKLAQNSLRQSKNISLCMATVAARAAIEGGVDVKTAFALSDLCIQKIEMLYDLESMLKLTFQLMLTYSELVGKAKYKFSNLSPISQCSVNYIKTHIYDNIRLENIAKQLKINKTYLCEIFKKDVGITVQQYVLNEKISEAKSILLLTEMPILEISNYLSFSSQSHLQNVFKRFTGVTPLEFRKAKGKIVQVEI